MEVVTVCPFRVASLLWQPRRGGWVLTVVCKATYDLAPVQSRLAANQDDPNEDDNHWNDDPARSVYSPSDLVPFKVRADVVLVGNAFASRGEASRSILTRLVVGGIDKSIEAFGERVYGPDGAVRETSRVTKVPLRYERATGGPDTLNPVGIRPDAQPDAYGVSPVPNLQPPGLLVQSRADVIPPIGYGPIAPTWPGRLEALGAYASSFSQQIVREQPVPDDIDPAYFDCAPRDQQLDELRDNERIVLENLHPQHPRLVTSLPGLHPRAFLVRPGGNPQDLTMKCDTLWIDTDRAQCTLTWRAQIGLDRPHGLGRVVVAMEEPGQRLTWADVERLLVASGQAGEPLPEAPAEAPALSTPPPSKPHRPATVPFLRPDVAGDIPAKPPSPSPAVSALSQMSAPRAENASPQPRVAPTASGLPFIAAKNVAPAGSAPQPPADRPPPGDAAPPWLSAARKSSSPSVPSPAVPNATPFAPAAAQPQPPPATPFAPPAAQPSAPPPPPLPARVPQAPPSPSPSPLDSPWANPSARAGGGENIPAPTVGSMAAGLSPPSPIAPTATAMAAAGLAGAAAVAAFSSASQAAPPPPVAVANAATVGAAAASNAAAAAAQWSTPNDGSSSPSPAVSPRPYTHRGPSRDVVDLIWYDPKAAPKMREHPSWKLLLDKKPEPRDLDFDDEPPPEEPPDVRDRKDVFAVLTRGATTDAEGIQEAIGDAVADDGTFTPPLVLVSAELTFPFDELETLKATVTAVSPLIAGDKKLKETVDTVNELLKTPWLSSSSGVAERLTQQVKDAFAQGNRMLPPSYLDSHTERMLLEQRHYQKRTVFGEPWIRSVLVPAGSQSLMPAYLPESLTKKLPMFQRFKARIVAEAHMQQDEYENHPAALKVVALGRVVSLQRRGFMR
ncbi:DUF2169 family type VI secretion system accessory protein [Polyangium mundeleinium]|uniref:DUF2169 domain-containing protein n=1 Tax=Polyangium mundeleinium TaxID=2995306 RepID=A0ABT5F2P0_9BACT|nr:DUF2169 domain-containing protein [Polyangium mundeleinium]MDC0748370.1 DUF2169 domain-containing protein [Polyangium mundeleinium]